MCPRGQTKWQNKEMDTFLKVLENGLRGRLSGMPAASEEMLKNCVDRIRYKKDSALHFRRQVQEGAKCSN